MDKKLKIGVFGAARGKTMIGVLLKHPDAALVAVCDKYEPAPKKVGEEAQKVGIEVSLYNNFEDFLNHPEMDAVVLANYATEHATFGIRCLKAGKHVLSEVLPCETMAQAVELIETVEQTGLVYSYAENYCYMRHTFEMWRRYKAGELGDVVYAEGEYIHDCTSIWPCITYGDRNHWRNNMSANFYCTHSLGPLMAITGLRPVQVVGYETLPMQSLIDLGYTAGAGIEMVTMENGAIFKSIHGGLKRQPDSVNYELYCEKGMMESGRIPDDNKKFNLYLEGEEHCKGEWEKYDPESPVAKDVRNAIGINSHGGSDFYATHCFIQKILGRPDGEWCIDVYAAVDMGICGLLAHRSVLNGNQPVQVPNLRDPAQRDAWRNDHACTNPVVAGDQVLPKSIHDIGREPLADEVYDRVKQMWLEGKNG